MRRGKIIIEKHCLYVYISSKKYVRQCGMRKKSFSRETSASKIIKLNYKT